MAEDINQDEDDIEEEEEDRGAEAQQTLDDLTVLGDSSDRLDDPEEQGPGDDLSEWEEPSASQSLSVIHTGSRPTDAELLSNLIPEGEVIVEEGEIVRTDEKVGEPLDDVEPPAVELESPERDDPPAECDPEPAPAPQAEADEPAPPPAPDDEPVVEERDVDVQPAEPAAAAAPPPEVLPVDPPDEEEEEEDDDDDGDDDDPLETTDAEGGEDSAIALDIDPGDATEVTIANVPEGATLSAGTDNGDGTWTLTADQLDDLTITPPADSDVDFTLEVTAGDDTESLDVTVNAVADAPTATAEDVSGTEDNPIDLDLASVVTDVDLRDADGNPILDENGDIVSSESLSITIGGVPDGATLSAGTDNGDGTWTLTADDLTGLQINPPADFAGEIPLTLTSTSTEADGGDSATTEVPFTVTVADTVDVTAATTLEDTAVALDIDLPEGVGSVDIADIPDGAILMSGGQVIDVTNGSVTLTAEQLVDLTIQGPLDSDVDFTLQVTADGVTQDLDVTVIADVDKPTADGQDESGVAGSEIPLNLTAGLSDTDGSETLSITLGGIPDGAVLTSGGETITIGENGNADVSPDQLAGLQITPPADSNEDFELTVTATSADGDDTATTSGTIDVSVTGDADTASLDLTAAAGNEDTAIALDIDAGLADGDGSETLSISIGDIPAGSTLTSGGETITVDENGNADVSPDQLAGLQITPPDDFSGTFDLTVTATTTEDDGDTSTTSGTLTVDVDGVVDDPTLSASDASCTEDQAIDLNITADTTDGSETLSVSIGGIPDGAVLTSGGETITVDENGNADVSLDQLAGLQITPSADSDGDFQLTVTATSADGDDTATSTSTMDVSVAADADAPTLNLADAAGSEDTAIGLDISSALTDTDGSETLSVTIGDIPAGSTLTSGGQTITVDENGNADIDPSQLAGLQITPPVDFSGSFDLTVTSTATEDDGGDTATTTGSITVDVAGVADDPTLSASDASGTEDQAIDLNITADTTDGSETLSVSIGGIPDGATLTSGGETITIDENGNADVSPDQLAGLQITPPADSDGDFQLTVTATSADGDDTATSTSTMDVSVAADADAPALNLAASAGSKDPAISLDISSGLTDTDDSETLSVTIGDIPAGSTLTSGFQTITVDENGNADIDPSQLAGLRITPPDDFSGSFDLTVTSTYTEENGGDTATTTGSITVDVEAVADDPTLSASDSAGTEDQSIALDIDAGVTDASESVSVTISGVPDGAALSAGTDNGDGSWTLDSGDLDGLTVTPPQDFSGSFDLTVTAMTTEDDGDTSTTSGSLTVDVAEGSTLNVSDAAGTEDTAIDLDIGVTQLDRDGSETVSVTVSGVPDGASLNAGTDNGDGTWALDAGDSDGLSVTPADDSSADLTLGISVTTTETSSGDTSTTTSTLDVDVAGVADAPTVSASTTFDSQESSETTVPVPQTITDAADTDGSTVTVSGVPNGASLSAGTDNGDGSWTLATDDLDSLTVTPAEGSSDDISLSFDVSGSGGPGDTVGSEDFSSGVSGWSGGMSANNGEMKIGGDNMDETASKTFDFGDEHAGQTVTVSFDVEMFGGWDESGGSRDYFQVSANDSQVINTTDDDQNSSSFEVTLDENGQVDLTFGADTTYSPEGVNIDNLSFTAGDDWDSSLASETVDVTPEAGGFNYDLDITAGLNDTDGSESLSITVSDMPNGATLSAGTDNGNGTWTLDAGDLDGLQVTVPTDAGEFDLSVSATATESDGDTNSVSTSVSISTPDTVAEDAALSTTDASGEEDRAIALEIDASLTDTDGSETLSISISGVPEGAELSSGTDNGDGSWTLDAGDLDGLTILPPTDSSADMSLTVTATTTETSTGNTSEVTSTMNVTVDGVADAPELSVSLGDGVEAGGGATPVSYWKMDENDNWADEGQTIADAMGNNNGAVGEDGQDLNDNGVFSKAAEFESGYGDHIEVPHDDSLKPESGALTMWFNADSTSGRNTLASSDSSGNDDGGHFGLFVENGTLRVRMQSEDDETDFTGGSVSTNEWNQVTVTWGEDGANVYLNGELVASDDDWTDGLAGNENPWTFGANQWSSGDNTANNLQDYFDGHIDDIAIYDEQLSSSDVQALFDDGVQDVMDSDEGGDSIQYPVDITAALADTDGSKSMSISIEGIPDGAELSAGTDNGDGTWSVDEGDLDGLTLTVPADADDFAMSVSATVTDEGGDTRTVIETVKVDVSGDGFDAGTTGTSAGDTLTGSAGDDLISGQDGNDDISGGGGADTLLVGEGDDQIDGGDGNDVIDGGAGDDTIDSGAGDDNVMGGQGDDLFIFGSGDGADYFQGGDGWSDTVQLDDVSGGPGGDSGWTLQVDEGAGYTQTDSGIEFDAEASGVITLDDGSELTFDGVEKLEW